MEGDFIAGSKIGQAARRPYHSAHTCQVALDAHRITALGLEFRWVDHTGAGRILNVLASRTVAPFAGYSTLGERRVAVSILRSSHIAHLTGVTRQATSFHPTVEADLAILLVPG